MDLERKLHEEREALLAAISDHVAAPLTAVARLAEILGDRTRDSSAAVRNEMIEFLAIQTHEVEHVVKDVVAAARLDLGELGLGSESVNLREAVEAAIHDWEQAQRARLSVTGDSDARGDARWVAHIVSNLLRNAVALGGEKIQVRIANGFNKVVLEVVDDGAEVVEKDREKIFEPYYKGRSASFGTSSLGLGLSVAQRLATAMGGEVRYYRDDNENVFELSLRRMTATTGRRGQLPDVVIDPLAGRPTHESVSELLAGSGPSMAYQPIVDMRSNNRGEERIVGYESLARFPHSSPDEWFETAGSAGVRLDLELAAIRTGIKGFTSGNHEMFLALNLSDATLISSRLESTLAGIGPGRVVLELSESARIKSYEVTRRAVDALRDRGIRLAVDDVGAGEIDLWHILRLEPDIIKIDRHLVADTDHIRRNNALIRGITTMAQDLGIMVVAEAVETQNEQQRLLELGVQFGQGYLFGKPRPLQLKTKVLTDDDQD